MRVISPAGPGALTDEEEIDDKLSTSTLLAAIVISLARPSPPRVVLLITLEFCRTASFLTPISIPTGEPATSPNVSAPIWDWSMSKRPPRMWITPAPVPLKSLTSNTALFVKLTVPN